MFHALPARALVCAALILALPHAGLAAGREQVASQEVASTAPVPEPSGKQANWAPGMAGSFLSSRFATQHRDTDEAAKYLAESLAHDPENEGLRQHTMRAQLVAGNTGEAVKLAKSLQKSAGKDPLVAVLVMIDAVRAGKFDLAQKAIALPADRGLFGVIRPAMREWISVAAGGLSAPVNMDAAIEKSGFFAPFLHYHAALMNDVLGFSDIALAHYQKASAESSSRPYRVTEALANYYARKGDAQAARKVFEEYAQENPASTLIPDMPGSAGAAPLVANAGEGLAELFFSTASILFGEDMTSESFIYLRLALALRPDLPPATLMLASLYEGNAEHERAIALYDSIGKGTVFYRRAQVRKALNLEALGKTEEAMELLHGISEAYPKEELALITLGDMYREQKLYEKAVEAYGEAISRAGTLRPTDWPLFYARGIAYERAGMWNAAERDLKQALKLQPNTPEVLNYLGYSWLLMGKHTKKARDYIEIALSARPDDPHILDSMGWAHYLAGEYDEAVALLERALEMMPQDPTVNDHLGDAYWQVGRKNEAKYQWDRALSYDPDPQDAQRIRDKIASGKPSASLRRASRGEGRLASARAE